MEFGGALSGAIVAEVVFIHAINDVLKPALGGNSLEHGKELVFTVEAAVRVVPDVIGVFEFVRFDVLVADSELLDEGFGVAFMGFGDGGGIGRDGESVVSEGGFGRPGEPGGIGAARVSDDDAIERAKQIEQLFLSGEQRGIGHVLIVSGAIADDTLRQ